MPEESYASYLLRLWKAERGRLTVWRASLEDVRTRERIYLDINGLLSFLHDRFVSVEANDRLAEPEKEADGNQSPEK